MDENVTGYCYLSNLPSSLYDVLEGVFTGDYVLFVPGTLLVEGHFFSTGV